MARCTPGEYAGRSTIIVYPQWPYTDHPLTAAQDVFFAGTATYAGPDVVAAAPATPRKLEAKRLGRPDPLKEVLAITPANLAKRRQDIANAEQVAKQALANYQGSSPPFAVLPVEVALFQCPKPLVFCGKPVSYLAMVHIAEAEGDAVPADDLRYVDAHVQVMVLAAEVGADAIFGREQVLARRVGSIGPVFKPSDWDR